MNMLKLKLEDEEEKVEIISISQLQYSVDSVFRRKVLSLILLMK